MIQLAVNPSQFRPTRLSIIAYFLDHTVTDTELINLFYFFQICYPKKIKNTSMLLPYRIESRILIAPDRVFVRFDLLLFS